MTMELGDRPLSGRDRALALDGLLAIVTFTAALEWTSRVLSRRRPPVEGGQVDRAADLWFVLASIERLAFHLALDRPAITGSHRDLNETGELLRDGALHIAGQELSRRLADLHRRLMDYYPMIEPDVIESARLLAVDVETALEMCEIPTIGQTEQVLTFVAHVRRRVPALF